MGLTNDLTNFTTVSPVIANYDYVDIANGLGYNTFYATRSKDSGGSDYHLIDQALPVADDIGGTNPTYGTIDVGSFDFDSSTFSLPRTFKGTAYISCSFTRQSTNGNFTARLNKNDSSTEKGISETITSVTITANGTYDIFLEMPLTETTVNTGELLRLKLTLNGANNLIGIDPTGNSTGVGGASQNPFKFLVPSKIDV